MAISKRIKAHREHVKVEQTYPIDEALTILKETSSVKFNESVDVAINLGVDARKSDQQIKGASLLPHGVGKTVRVAVFAREDDAKQATQAGADAVGFDDLAEQFKEGNVPYDVIIATPDSISVVSKLGKVLGPKGLMPNPKMGTVTTNVKRAVEEAKSGQVRYKTDKGGIVHCTIGRVSFEVVALRENLNSLIADLNKAKPVVAKGIYLKKISLSTTMGAGIIIDQSSLS